MQLTAEGAAGPVYVGALPRAGVACLWVAEGPQEPQPDSVDGVDAVGIILWAHVGCLGHAFVSIR